MAAVLVPEQEDGAEAEHDIALHTDIDRNRGHDQAGEVQHRSGRADMRDQESGGREQHRDQRRDAAVAAIGEPSCDRRSEHAGDAGQREQRDAALGEAELAGELERRHRPEQGEGAEQARLIDRAAPQQRRSPHQMRHRQQQFAIVHPRDRLALRQRHPEHGCEHDHQRGGAEEHRVPRQHGCDEARQRTRQHDSEHQAGRDVADDAAADGFRRRCAA